MTRQSLFPFLDQTDVSYDKLIELQSRLLNATRADLLRWERQGDSYALNKPSAVVDVSPAGVKIYDDRGRQLRRFRYETDVLYVAVRDWFNAMAKDTLDRILADLEAL